MPTLSDELHRLSGPAGDLLHYPMLLPSGEFVHLYLPRMLTSDDVVRITRWLQTLVMDRQ